MTAEFSFVAPTADSNSLIRAAKESVHPLAGSVLTRLNGIRIAVTIFWAAARCRAVDPVMTYSNPYIRRTSRLNGAANWKLSQRSRDGDKMMGHSNAGPTPPDDQSEALIQRVDALAFSELESLLSYIEQRLEALGPPIEAELETNAAGAASTSRIPVHTRLSESIHSIRMATARTQRSPPSIMSDGSPRSTAQHHRPVIALPEADDTD